LSTNQVIESYVEARESAVRSYARSFPTVFTSAKGAELRDEDGRTYIDFLAGAGALNFGHNHDTLKSALIKHIEDDGLAHGLDLRTSAKEAFLASFTQRILEPRRLDHRVQFTGPTGTNAVEAALKIARRATGRTGVFAFMGGYHGHSLGSLAVTANREHRAAAGVGLPEATFVPFPGGPVDSLAYLRMLLEDTHSGAALPAAIILETVQAEGGVNVAPTEWLRAVRQLCTEHGIVLVIDEIQTGVGRTGPYFSFEHAGIVPDVVTLSKSISGFGLPMSIVLLRPELDLWQPGEHTGTFRGNQLAFTTGALAAELFESEEIEERVARHATTIETWSGGLDPRLERRGLGLLQGIDTVRCDPSGGLAREIGSRCFADGLVIERTGRNDTVLKILPPLTIRASLLEEGLDILQGAVQACLD
jgi:diaminobutyrate-2-oxoglutarate transaminase